MTFHVLNNLVINYIRYAKFIFMYILFYYNNQIDTYNIKKLNKKQRKN